MGMMEVSLKKEVPPWKAGVNCMARGIPWDAGSIMRIRVTFSRGTEKSSVSPETPEHGGFCGFLVLAGG
jgi:hypothetical protein